MSTQAQTQTDLMKRTVRRLFDEVMNAQNLDALADFYSSDVSWHGPGGMELAGLDGLREMIGGYITAFPDLRMSISTLVAEGDIVCTNWRGVGTHDGPLGDIPATGKPLDITGMVISRFEGSMIVEEWELFDELLMLKQIGAMES